MISTKVSEPISIFSSFSFSVPKLEEFWAKTEMVYFFLLFEESEENQSQQGGGNCLSFWELHVGDGLTRVLYKNV